MFAARGLVGCVLAAVLAMRAVQLYGADEAHEEALDLLRRSLQHQDVMRRISLRARSEFWHQHVGKPRTTGVETVQGARFDGWLEQAHQQTAHGAAPIATSSRVVVTPERVVLLPGPPGTMPNSIVYGGREKAARYCRLGVRDAYIDGCEPLILLRDRLSSEVRNLRRLGRERILGVDCEVIEGETRYGEFRVCIAPERQYHQVRWRLVRRPHHYIPSILGDTLLRDEPAWETEHGPVKVETNTQEVEITEFAELEGKLIPSAGVEHGVFLGEDGIKLSEGATVIRRSDIKLLTDRAQVEQALAVDVPDGTYVTNLDDRSGVEYEWRRGKVVRRHTQFSGAARGQWQPRPMWVYVAWIVLALAMAGVALRVWYASRAKPRQEAP